MAAAYLVAETTAGWLTWLFAGTVVLLPTWATAWASIERRLVVLAGLPPIAPRAAGRAGRLREVAFALVLAVVAILGTVAGTAHHPQRRHARPPGGRLLIEIGRASCRERV